MELRDDEGHAARGPEHTSDPRLGASTAAPPATPAMRSSQRIRKRIEEGFGRVIETTGGEEEIKLPAGSMVVYPSTTLHRVEPVSRGLRRAAVGWVSSLVRSAEQREVLFDLDLAAEEMRQLNAPRTLLDKVMKTRSNLLHMWAEN